MYYTEEQKREVELQESIEGLKTRISDYLKKIYITELKYGSLSTEEKEEIKTLYSQVIAKLNECFFDYNVSSMMKYLRDEGFSIPHNEIINLMNVEELNSYKTMLSKFYFILSHNKMNIKEILLSAEEIGQNEKKIYILNYKNTPLNVLKNRLTEEKQKKELESAKLRELKAAKEELKQYKKLVKELTEENNKFRKVLKLKERK